VIRGGSGKLAQPEISAQPESNAKPAKNTCAEQRDAGSAHDENPR
jgi:hypothetical protein